MSMITLVNIALAKTPEEKVEAQKLHYEAVKKQPSDAEILTSFLADCTTLSGEKIVNQGEYAKLSDGKITISKSN